MTDRLKNWAPIINTVLLVLTIISLAVAGEHRITTVEGRQDALEAAVMELKDISRTATFNQSKNTENLARVTAILEMLCDEQKRGR